MTLRTPGLMDWGSSFRDRRDTNTMHGASFYATTCRCFTLDDVRDLVECYASTAEDGEPLPIAEQEDPDVQEAMEFLAQAEKRGLGGATFYGPEYDWTEEAHETADAVVDSFDRNQWPFNHIDWEAAGQELADGCSSFDFDGETFLYRD